MQAFLLHLKSYICVFFGIYSIINPFAFTLIFFDLILWLLI